jgi:hypothetical protein
MRVEEPLPETQLTLLTFSKAFDQQHAPQKLSGYTLKVLPKDYVN